MSITKNYDLTGKVAIVTGAGDGIGKASALKLAEAGASVLTPEIEKKMLAKTPLDRLGTVDDISNGVLYFASPASAWTNGQILYINGGGIQELD